MKNHTVSHRLEINTVTENWGIYGIGCLHRLGRDILEEYNNALQHTNVTVNGFGESKYTESDSLTHTKL